ncbi:MAG: ATP-binding protein [Candidatus Omnitrophota bacterium]
MKFRIKLTIVLIGLSSLACFLSIALSYRDALDNYKEELRNSLINIAARGAELIDPVKHSAIPLNPKGVNTAEYKEIKAVLKRMRAVNPTMRYVYTMVKTQNPNVLQFVVDAEDDPELFSAPGERYDISAFEEMKKSFAAPTADKKLTKDKWGTGLSGYAPIHDKNGNAVAILGVDLPAETYLSAQAHIIQGMGITLVISIALSIIISVIIANTIARPVELLSVGTKRISAGDFSVSLKAGSKDELGELISAFNKMANNLKIMNRELESEKLSLEKKVGERTKDLHKTMEELKKVHASLRQAEKLASLGRFVSVVAHEINNPLGIISGKAQLCLQDKTLTEKFKKDLEIMLEQCNRARDIVHKFFTFAKPRIAAVASVDINSALNYTINLLEQQFKDISIIKKYAASLPGIKADEHQLQEVFINLLTNAHDALRDGGTITVSTAVAGDSVKIEFRDTGAGIPADIMEKIYEPFFSTKENSAGLGIPISYNIVKAHGGNITYESKPGYGTVVTIILPIGGRRDV